MHTESRLCHVYFLQPVKVVPPPYVTQATPTSLRQPPTSPRQPPTSLGQPNPLRHSGNPLRHSGNRTPYVTRATPYVTRATEPPTSLGQPPTSLGQPPTSLGQPCPHTHLLILYQMHWTVLILHLFHGQSCSSIPVVRTSHTPSPTGLPILTLHEQELLKYE